MEPPRDGGGGVWSHQGMGVGGMEPTKGWGWGYGPIKGWGGGGEVDPRDGGGGMEPPRDGGGEVDPRDGGGGMEPPRDGGGGGGGYGVWSHQGMGWGGGGGYGAHQGMEYGPTKGWVWGLSSNDEGHPNKPDQPHMFKQKINQPPPPPPVSCTQRGYVTVLCGVPDEQTLGSKP